MYYLKHSHPSTHQHFPQHLPPRTITPYPPEGYGVGVLVIQLCCVVVHHVQNDLDARIVQPAATAAAAPQPAAAGKGQTLSTNDAQTAQPLQLITLPAPHSTVLFQVPLPPIVRINPVSPHTPTPTLTPRETLYTTLSNPVSSPTSPHHIHPRHLQTPSKAPFLPLSNAMQHATITTLHPLPACLPHVPSHHLLELPCRPHRPNAWCSKARHG